jgi:hypothetical protein
VLIHAGGFNLGLLMRRLIGVGTPRGLQGRCVAALVALLMLIRTLWETAMGHQSPVRLFSRRERLSVASHPLVRVGMREPAFTTGC